MAIARRLHKKPRAVRPVAQARLAAGWQHWLDWRDGDQAASAGINRSAKGPVEQARRLVIRAYRRRVWGLPGGDYRDAAERLTLAGYPTTEQEIKNGARGALVEHAIPVAVVVEFITAVRAIWPTFEWQLLVEHTRPQEVVSQTVSEDPNRRDFIKKAQV